MGPKAKAHSDVNNYSVPKLLAFGAIAGTIAGHLDRKHVEPIGCIIAGSFAAMHLLEYGGFATLPWSNGPGKDARGFIYNSLPLVSGYAVGHLIGYTILEDLAE